MRNKAFLLLLLGIVGFAGCSKKENQPIQPFGRQEPSYGQRSQSSAPDESHQMDTEDMPEYNVQSVQTIQGQIVQMLRLSGPEGGEQVGVMVRTNQGTIPVVLGPSSFVLGGNVQLTPFSNIEVIGSVLYVEGRIIVVAQTIKVDGYTLAVRDKNGHPLWSGWKKE